MVGPSRFCRNRRRGLEPVGVSFISHFSQKDEGYFRADGMAMYYLDSWCSRIIIIGFTIHGTDVISTSRRLISAQCYISEIPSLLCDIENEIGSGDVGCWEFDVEDCLTS